VEVLVHARAGELVEPLDGRDQRRRVDADRRGERFDRVGRVQPLGQLTRRVPHNEGGLYAYARHEFGDFAGYLTAWCYWITCWAGNAAIVSSWVLYVEELFGIDNPSNWTNFGIALTGLWVPAVINLVGVRQMAFFQNVTVVLKFLPLPNVPSTGAGSGALSNFTRQETPENPRMNNLLRIDGRPSGNNSYWFSYRQFSSKQYGSEITAGPAKWGFFDGSYVSGDSGINGGWNHVSSSNRVNEFGAGVRRATEGFGVKNDSDYA